MKPLKINPDFKSLIPPLLDAEYRALEESIISQGQCRDTIKVWKGIIVDGHNRYAICQKHGIPYRLQEVRLASKKDAELWIIQNQLGRRNLTNAMRIRLVLRKEALLKQQAKQNRKGLHESLVHVRKIIAKEAGVSERTVYKYMKIRELATSELIARVEAGESTIGAGYRDMIGHGGVTTGALPKPNAPALEVTTRIVEVYDDDDTPDISKPNYRAAVLGNIEKVERLYGFVLDNAELLKGEEGVQRVYGRLRMQLRVVRGSSGGKHDQ